MRIGSSWPRRSRRFATVAIAVALFVAACGSSPREIVARGGDLDHVHDLVLDTDATLLVASHMGLYRIEAIDRAVLVGTEQHDLTSLARLDTGELVASGHPSLLTPDYHVEGKPPLFGLAQSSDGGLSWRAEALIGEADFHALVPHGDGVFAAESGGRVWFRDADGSWSQLGEIQAMDLAIDPRDANRQLAPDYDGMMWASTDGAMNWAQLEHTPALVEVEWPDRNTILGIDQAGNIWFATALDSGWEQVASGPTEPKALYVDGGGTWWVAVRGGAIARSDDAGDTWADVYIPPDRD